eukprot:SAG11_NODE_1852_length_4166_cov_156.696090_2_plen_67_part_00
MIEDEPEEEVINVYTFEGVDYNNQSGVLYNIADRAVIGFCPSKGGKISFLDNGEKIHKKNKKKCSK